MPALKKATGILTLGFLALALANPPAVQRIVLIGDSTVADYPASQAPMTGWGQVLEQRRGATGVHRGRQ